MPRVGIVGGSLGGLTAALVLRDAGCAVQVYERSSAVLEARGAGIAVLDETLRYLVERRGLAPETFCTSTSRIRFVTSDGSVGHETKHRYRFSSWNAIYRSLLNAFGTQHYRLGCEVTSFAAHDDGIVVEFADGREHEFVDLLVNADGINSRARRVLFPQVAPHYSGYVAWRGTVGEAALRRDTYDALHDALTYQLMADSHILVYPIPGPDGALEPGRRLMNLVWYRNVADGDDLAALLTDRSGLRRSVSVPPGAVRDEALAELRALADVQLAPAIADVVSSAPEPFVQAVFDIEVPRMVAGHSCLIGDAAFAVRPHAAAGTAKAAEDAWVLAEELEAADGNVGEALERWEKRQLVLGRSLLERTRQIGDSSQFTGSFRPADPQLIFGLYGPGR